MPYYKDDRVVAKDEPLLGVQSADFQTQGGLRYCLCNLRLEDGTVVEGQVLVKDAVIHAGTPKEETLTGALTVGELAAVDAAIAKVAAKLLEEKGLEWADTLPQKVEDPK